MPESLPDCVVFKGGIAYIFFTGNSDTKESSTVSLREKKRNNICAKMITEMRGADLNTESRLDESSLSLLLREKRKKERDTRRKREGDTREERREKRRERRSRVYVKNVLVCTFKTSVSYVTRAF